MENERFILMTHSGAYYEWCSMTAVYTNTDITKSRVFTEKQLVEHLTHSIQAKNGISFGLDEFDVLQVNEKFEVLRKGTILLTDNGKATLSMEPMPDTGLNESVVNLINATNELAATREMKEIQPIQDDEEEERATRYLIKLYPHTYQEGDISLFLEGFKGDKIQSCQNINQVLSYPNIETAFRMYESLKEKYTYPNSDYDAFSIEKFYQKKSESGRIVSYCEDMIGEDGEIVDSPEERLRYLIKVGDGFYSSGSMLNMDLVIGGIWDAASFDTYEDALAYTNCCTLPNKEVTILEYRQMMSLVRIKPIKEN